MSNEFEKEPTKPTPFHEIPGGGDLPVTTNFTYQPGATSEPDENTTSVTIDFDAKPNESGWTWQAWGSTFSDATDRVSSSIPTTDRGFTTATSLSKGSSTYFGVYVKCTKAGSTDETQGILYQWSDGAQHGSWTVTLTDSDTNMMENP